MKKRTLTMWLAGFALLALLTGCARNTRNFQGGGPTEVPLTPTPVPTDVPVQATPTPVLPTATVAPTQPAASTPSAQISNQLDDILNQLDQQLNSIDTLDDTPAAP